MQAPSLPQAATPPDAPSAVLIVLAVLFAVVGVGLLARFVLEQLRRRRSSHRERSVRYTTPPRRRAVIVPDPESRAGSTFVPNVTRRGDVRATERHRRSPLIPRPQFDRDHWDSRA